MSLEMRKFVKKQSKADKEIAAEILNTTQQLLKDGKTEQALKYLMHNRRKYENRPKPGLFKSLLNRLK